MSPTIRFLVVCILFFNTFSETCYGQPLIYKFSNCTVEFISNAPLETISATSTEANGLVNFDENTFAITLYLNSFYGFNSLLQQEHFNENYVESNLFPKSIFKGKIIEPVNLKKNGEIIIRTKGLLEIHGETKEHIIPVILSINNSNVTLNAKFDIELSDYNISIPRIVRSKISETIQVNVYAELVPYTEIEN